MKLLQTLKLIDRIDQLVRLKATGTPSELANKLEISERSARRLITTMKEMGAPIKYCNYKRSYTYEDKVYFRFGFFCKRGESDKLYGGVGTLSPFFTRMKQRRSNDDRGFIYTCKSSIAS